VRYYRAPRLFESLTISHGDGSYLKFINQLAKADLLIIDDWGLETLTQSQRNDLLEIMEDRHGSKSTIVTSQLPMTKWHSCIGDATLADAILDRLLHNGHKLQLKGESMRKTMSSLTEDEHLVSKDASQCLGLGGVQLHRNTHTVLVGSFVPRKKFIC